MQPFAEAACVPTSMANPSNDAATAFIFIGIFHHMR